MKCKLGLHKWEMIDGDEFKDRFPRRICLECGKQQRSCYDMYDGSTIWEEENDARIFWEKET